MAGRSSKADNRGADLFGMLVSGKSKDFRTFKSAARGLPPEGMTATGGIINDYTVSGTTYRAHIFTASGAFEVSELSNDSRLGDDIDYLVVGGGGGAGAYHSTNGTGGAGAGGLRSNMPSVPYATPAYTIGATGPYTVVVGGGGGYDREDPSNQTYASQGSDSQFYLTSGGSGSGIVASGGGAGQSREWTPGPVQMGGSGGGGDTYSPSSYTGTTVTSPDSLIPNTQGYPGGVKQGNSGGGGGGAGEAGNTNGQGRGGDGLQVLIAEPPATPAPTRQYGADGGYFAGGGGGEYYPGTGTPGYAGGLGGGGSAAARTSDGVRGKQNTGGGGAGSKNDGVTPAVIRGDGGSGIVIVRYKIAEAVAAKATGGFISFTPTHTVHTFVDSGVFENTSGSDITNVELSLIHI